MAILKGQFGPPPGAPAFIPNLRAKAKWYRCFACDVKFMAKQAACPGCGRSQPQVSPLVLIHLLQPHPAGRIHSVNGSWRLACDARRDYIATHRRVKGQETNNEQASGDLASVNCPDCLGTLGLTYEQLQAELSEKAKAEN